MIIIYTFDRRYIHIYTFTKGGHLLCHKFCSHSQNNNPFYLKQYLFCFKSTAVQFGCAICCVMVVQFGCAIRVEVRKELLLLT